MSLTRVTRLGMPQRRLFSMLWLLCWKTTPLITISVGFQELMVSLYRERPIQFVVILTITLQLLRQPLSVVKRMVIQYAARFNIRRRTFPFIGTTLRSLV